MCKIYHSKWPTKSHQNLWYFEYWSCCHIYTYMYKPRQQKQQRIYHSRESLMNRDRTSSMADPLGAELFWGNIKSYSHFLSFTAQVVIITPMEDKDLFVVSRQYHGCWWPGDSRSQGINSHGIVLVLPEYSSLSTRRANMYLVQCVTVISALYTRELNWYHITTIVVLTYCSLGERSIILKHILYLYMYNMVPSHCKYNANKGRA